MTDTNPRDLIQRLADMADALDGRKPLVFAQGQVMDGFTALANFQALANEARAYLSQSEPEEPADEELLAIAIESELVASNGTNPFREDSDIEDEVMQFARTVLARWGRNTTTEEP